MTARLATLLVGVMALVLFAAGCGGDDENGSSSEVSTSSLGKAAYVKKANAICEDGREKAIAFATASGGEQAGEQVAKAVEADIVPAFEEVATELQDLGAPQGDEAQIEAFLDAFREGTEQLEEDGASSITSLGLPFKRSAKLAREYGIAGPGGFGGCAFSS